MVKFGPALARAGSRGIYLAAIEALEGARPGAGAALNDLIEAILKRVGAFPRSFRRAQCKHTGEVLQVVIRRFGYLLYYEIQSPDTIVILGFWHGPNEPGLWETH